MATVTYVGRQRTQRQVNTVTIGSATAAQTFTLTAGPTRTVTYTAGSGETTTTVAAALWALAVAAVDGEFTELDWGQTAPTSASFTVTGPDDGAPFDLTAGGTGTITSTTTTDPLSPHDVADGANYDSGALPVDGVDDLVIEATAADMKYNADALAAIDLGVFTRRATHTGRLGLPEQNANGYREYRATRLSVKAPSIIIETTRDDAESLKVLATLTGAPVTVTIRGDGSRADVGAEAVDLSGLPGGESNVVDVSRSSVAVCPLTGDVATITTFLGVGSAVRLGLGTTLTGPTLTECAALVECSWSGTLTMDGGTVEVGRAAAGVFVVEAGTLTWLSTGNPGNSPVVGSDGTLDLSQAPKVLTIGGTVALHKGATLDDSAGRGGGYAVQAVHGTLDDVTWKTNNGRTYTLS